VPKKEKISGLRLEKDHTTPDFFWFPHSNCDGAF